jgi:carbonic anhydrase
MQLQGELAVLDLKVKDGIICGHSNRGAMQALYRDEKEMQSMPDLKEWLQMADSVKELILRHYVEATNEIRQRVKEEENVLLQLHNIQTYPFVRQALDDGALHLHGWYYNIATGSIYAYNSSEDVSGLSASAI